VILRNAIPLFNDIVLLLAIPLLLLFGNDIDDWSLFGVVQWRIWPIVIGIIPIFDDCYSVWYCVPLFYYLFHSGSDDIHDHCCYDVVIIDYSHLRYSNTDCYCCVIGTSMYFIRYSFVDDIPLFVNTLFIFIILLFVSIVIRLLLLFSDIVLLMLILLLL